MPRPVLSGRHLLAWTVAAVVVAVPAAGTASTKTPTVAVAGSHQLDQGIRTSVRGCSGAVIRRQLYRRECVQVTASGFSAGQAVLVGELSRPGWRQTVRAGSGGLVRYRLVLAATARTGHDVLTFVGQGSAVPAQAAGTLSVNVPRVAVCPFEVTAGR